jgi:hypothetical protein
MTVLVFPLIIRFPSAICLFFFLTLLLLQRENLQKEHKSDLQQILHFEERQDDSLEA